MTIDELIEALQNIREEYGLVPIYGQLGASYPLWLMRAEIDEDRQEVVLEFGR